MAFLILGPAEQLPVQATSLGVRPLEARVRHGIAKDGERDPSRVRHDSHSIASPELARDPDAPFAVVQRPEAYIPADEPHLRRALRRKIAPPVFFPAVPLHFLSSGRTPVPSAEKGFRSLNLLLALCSVRHGGRYSFRLLRKRASGRRGV